MVLQSGLRFEEMREYRIWCLMATAVFLLSGCLGKPYERIESRTAGGPAIIIEPETSEGIRIQIEKPGLSQAESQEGAVCTLLFAGDVLLSDHVLKAYEKAGGIHGVLNEGYRQAIENADYFFVNQEFPFSSRGTKAEDKQYTFRLPPEKVSLFQEMGIDGVTLANNHALDYGRDALLDSCVVLDQAGIAHTGAGENLDEAKRPVTAEIRGKKVGIIGATRVIPVADWAASAGRPGMLAAYDSGLLLEEIRAMRQSADYLVVCIHWGIEREEEPQEYQRTLGRQMIDAGADLVIGSHPHVLQGIEYYQGKPIIYSLGNFVFGSSIPRTALLQAELEEGEEEPSFKLLPGTSGAGYTQMITDERKKQEFFQYMEDISFGVEISEEGVIKPVS